MARCNVNIIMIRFTCGPKIEAINIICSGVGKYRNVVVVVEFNIRNGRNSLVIPVKAPLWDRCNSIVEEEHPAAAIVKNAVEIIRGFGVVYKIVYYFVFGTHRCSRSTKTQA